MSRESYVKFETAQLLKEKGFDWECYGTYNVIEEVLMNEYSVTVISHTNKNSTLGDAWISAPTQQMACRWLREVHNIFIGVGIGEDLDGEFGYMPFIHILDNLSCPDGKYMPDVDADDICNLTPQTYEDAVEAALEYALKNLI